MLPREVDLMGMFDTILCRRPLPDGLVAEDFQSKSLHNMLSVYEIGLDGRLRELGVNDGGAPMKEAARDTCFHGVLRFHALAGDSLRNYEAKFTDGSLVELRTEEQALYDECGLLRTRENGR